MASTFARKTEQMEKILIPTDFTEESLQLIEFALLNFTSEKLDIVLVHGYRIPDIDIRHYSPNKVLSRLCPDNLSRTLRNLTNEYQDRINSIKIQLYTGSNSLVFKEFLIENQISASVLPSSQFTFPRGSQSFDLTRLILRHVDRAVTVPLTIPDHAIVTSRFSFLGLWYF